MRIARATIDRVETLPVGEIDRHIGLADDHRAGLFQAPHQYGILGGDVIAIFGMAEGGWQAGDIEAFLDRHRHAEQRLIAPSVLGRSGRIKRAGSGIGRFEIGDRQRVDAGIKVLEPHDRRIHRLGDAQPPLADRRRRGERAGFLGQLRISHAMLLSLARHAIGLRHLPEARSRQMLFNSALAAWPRCVR